MAVPTPYALAMICVALRLMRTVIPAPFFEVGNTGFLVRKAAKSLYQVQLFSLSLDYVLSLTDSDFSGKTKMG